MISLDIDLSYLSKYYNIGEKDLEKYRYKSISQIMETEAEHGNQRAAEFLMRITSNPNELVKVFRLFEPKNRYLILLNMNKDDLMSMMEFLDPAELILGLSIFNRDILVDLMKNLDPEALTKVVLNKMDINKFLKVIPEEYMDEFFASDKLNKNILIKAMEEVDEEQLQKMMENFTGQPCYDNRDNILKKVDDMDEYNFKRCILSSEVKGKQQIIANVIKEKPDLFQEFSVDAMVHPFTNMEKEEILKSLTVLETKDMLPMVEDLPQDIMALVATQINPEIFAQILTKNFSDVIADCGINI